MLKGKVAFITGSTRGIGWAIAQRFADEGANVIINGFSNGQLLESRIQELQKKSKKSTGYLLDITQQPQLKEAFQNIFKSFGRLDILVNNAGILNDGLIGMLSADVIHRTYEVNAIAVTQCIQAGVRLMTRGESGSIINISSISGTNGIEGQLLYSGTKAAVIGMTKAAAKELAIKNIRVNAIAPGFIETDMVRQLPADKYQDRVTSIKMKRIGKPEDIAGVALFLASDLSSYVTGQVIGVDGGMLV